jgi:hypothetical protein
MFIISYLYDMYFNDYYFYLSIILIVHYFHILTIRTNFKLFLDNLV